MPTQRLRHAPFAPRWATLFAILSSVLTVAGPKASAAPDDEARATAGNILQATGVTGGLVVHVGCGDGRLAAALGSCGEAFLVHGLDRDAGNVETAREYVRSRGLYGRVSIDRLAGVELPYIDNLVNLIVIDEAEGLHADEVMRVLAPRGVAYVRSGDGWRKTVKPVPAEIDEWTHYLHDASGNPVAHDSEVGPPRHLQWIGYPRWSRHHDRMASMNALVSAGGRLFYIMDEGSRVSIQLPAKWHLIACDAFNGMPLWKRPIPRWNSHLWPLKSGPTQLARRLVATQQRVFVTLGIDAPVTALAAATGEVVRTYSDTAGAEELILADGTLYVLVNRGESELANYKPQLNVGDQRRVSEEFQWNRQPRDVMAIDAESGGVEWQVTSRVAPLSLAAGPAGVAFYDGEHVVCLNPDTGERRWEAAVPSRRNVTMNFGPRVLLYGAVVLFAGGEGSMGAFAADSGESLWTAPRGRSGYQSPEDLMVADGLVWSPDTTLPKDTGQLTGRDPLTGEIARDFMPDVDTYWFHHRCHISKATDRFLLPSRTGIEFVDLREQHWQINDWVRGGCLYGVMPCNGLVYAPPHNCACYPETKLYGMNALAPASGQGPGDVDTPAEERLEPGPAYGDAIETAAAAGDWPQFRHDARRSGATRQSVPAELSTAWQSTLGGRLSAMTAAAGQLFVAAIDAHTVNALDQATGDVRWSYTVGARVDSPPAFAAGHVYFGSADGSVYCLRAADGALAWRFRAAPSDRRLVAYDQVESVWPVHGSVLVEDGVVSCVAGRSCFLDGGMRLYQLDAASGKLLTENTLDDRVPETGESLQARVQVLNMPVGLPDVLSSDGQSIYMRSQRFDRHGRRQELGPHSGTPVEQGSVQHGEGIHLFAPMGFLDGTYFHRSYWVYGRSFAGGHSGYYQAGKFAPAGRMLVFDDDSVYGFGRKAEHYRWTTIIEHQLFATSSEPPPTPKQLRRGGLSVVRFEKSPELNPAGKAVTVEAWVKANKPDGVVVARGGPARGYALYLKRGRPQFAVRVDSKVYTAASDKITVGRWVHLVGMLTTGKRLELYVDGQRAATAQAHALIDGDPAQSMQIGADESGAAGDYDSPFALTGLIDEVRVYHGTLTPEEIAAHHESPENTAAAAAQPVVRCSFDEGNANDDSGNRNHGELLACEAVEGRSGRALQFFGSVGRVPDSLVEHRWARDIPLFAHAMVLADHTLFVAGPPDLMDESETFAQLVAGDSRVDALLAEQDAALEGERGALLHAVSANDGTVLAEYALPSVPVWDGMIAAGGRLYVATVDGQVLCLAAATRAD